MEPPRRPFVFDSHSIMARRAHHAHRQVLTEDAQARFNEAYALVGYDIEQVPLPELITYTEALVRCSFLKPFLI